MEAKYYDVFGKELKVGDKVAFINRGYLGKDAKVGRGTIFRLSPCGAWTTPDEEYAHLGVKYTKCVSTGKGKYDYKWVPIPNKYGKKYSSYRFIIKLEDAQ